MECLGVVEFEWDEAKARANLDQHDVSFDDAHQFDWSRAQIFSDDRFDYGEDRAQARGCIDGRLHVLVFTLRNGRMRIISLGKANMRERRRYVAETGHQLGNT